MASAAHAAGRGASTATAPPSSRIATTRRGRVQTLAAVVVAAVLAIVGCGGAAAGRSAAGFCAKFRDFRAHSSSFGGFGGVGRFKGPLVPSTPTATAVPEYQRIADAFDQLDRLAPPAVKPAVDTGQAVFHYVLTGLTHTPNFGEFKVYQAAHPPPVDAARAAAFKQQLGDYLKDTCHLAPVRS